jgi:hypothetical protein
MLIFGTHSNIADGVRGHLRPYRALDLALALV